MTALSIRHMNMTLARREQEGFMALPTEEGKTRKSHYWWVERKTKRGRKWIFVSEHFGTEKAAQDYFDREYKDRMDFVYRLRRIYTY